MSKIITYKYPKKYNENKNIRAYADGVEQYVFSTPSTDIVSFSLDGSTEVKIRYNHDISEAVIRPVSFGIQAKITDKNCLSFKLDSPKSVLVDVKDERQLHIHANKIEETPDFNDPMLKYYKAGKVYEEGEIRLKNGEKMYIEGGAVVKGAIMTENADDIEIFGNGILDGSFFNNPRRLCIFRRCRNLKIRNILMVEPRLWMLMLHECENVEIDGLKEVGEVISSDGIDIVGSSNVLIHNCFLRNNDDCIAIKAMPVEDGIKARNVENVHIKNCVFLNDSSGNATEIGHELRCDRVKNIVFENCDILSVHGYGAPFSIHNADNAVVENISYLNMCVEHYYDKLVDIRVIKSMWGKSTERGFVKNISFKDIEVTASIYNPGYSISIIGGYDSEHIVDGVSFDNFKINGKKVMSKEALDVFLRDADNISFI